MATTEVISAYPSVMPQPVASATTQSTAAASSTVTGCLAKAKGALLLACAICVGGLGWLVLNILANDLRRAPDHAPRIAAFSRWMIEHRAFVPLAMLPAIVAGVLMLAMRSKSAQPPSMRRRARPWIVLALGTLWLVLVFALVLVAFVQFMAPLYQYQDI